MGPSPSAQRAERTAAPVCADRSPIMLLRALERTCWALGVGRWHHSWHSFSHVLHMAGSEIRKSKPLPLPTTRSHCAARAPAMRAGRCPKLPGCVYSLPLVPAACRRAMHRGPLSLLSTLARARHGRRVSHPRVAFHGAQPQPLPMQHRGLELKLPAAKYHTRS